MPRLNFGSSGLALRYITAPSLCHTKHGCRNRLCHSTPPARHIFKVFQQVGLLSNISRPIVYFTCQYLLMLTSESFLRAISILSSPRNACYIHIHGEQTYSLSWSSSNVEGISNWCASVRLVSREEQSGHTIFIGTSFQKS